MDDEQLKQLIREHYPFPIAYAHKKTLGVLDEGVEKLKCLLETAETIIQFLALLALAQVRQDLLNPPLLHPPVPLKGGIVPQASSLANTNLPDFRRLQENISLATPSFGKWNHLTRDVMKAYHHVRDRLVVPELFELFWRVDASSPKLRSQPLDNKVIGPLITLRNAFHHGRVPDHAVHEHVREGLNRLHQLLEAIQFVAEYQLSFTQRITVRHDARRHKKSYIHDLTLFNGCFSPFDQDRWQSEIDLESETVLFLHPQQGKHLSLTPFMIFTNQVKGVSDLLLLNNLAKKKAVYVSSQFGEVLETTHKEWSEGTEHYGALTEFLEQLQNVPQTSSSVDVAQASSLAREVGDEREKAQAGTLTVHEEDSRLSTAEVFQQQYQAPEHGVQHTSPYKFLDYYNPEDHDIFFGRDREIRMLLQKFYNTRLLVLHGESGTGKTSLIRAGLIPQLDQESYIPVYVRVLKEPLREIKRELLHQLGLEDATRPGKFSETFQVSLAELLRQITERVSKTVIIVLDQFEEFFLRFPKEVRQQFEEEFATCVQTPRLDVKFLVSLRSDYFSYLATFEDSIPQIFTHQLQLERLTEVQALEAVIKPAERLGIQVDEVMVQIKLLPELKPEEGIEPPLLQIVCDALYQNAQSEGRSEIGMVDYEAVSDVKGALGKYLDDKLRQFGKNQRTAKAVLKTLVTTEGTKRATFVEELLSRIRSAGLEMTEEVLKQKYLDKFVRDRLVRVEEVEGETRYELSHEYLVTHIGAWIEESEREITKILELIDRAYEAYQSTELLLESSALQMIKPFEEQIILPSDKQAFVDRSKTQVRKKRRGLLLKVAALLMFVALVIGGIFGYQTYQAYQETIRQRDIAIAKQQEAEEQRQRAEQQTEIAKENLRQSKINEIEALNQTSKALFFSHDELGALLAGVKAEKKSKQLDIPTTLKNQTMLNLLEVVYNIHEKNRLEKHEDAVLGINFSPDGTMLASGSWDNTIKLWEVADGREITTLHGHSAPVMKVSFSPGGTLLASGSRDNTIKLWNVSDGKEITTLHGHSDIVASVSFSPDGTLLASGSWDNTIKLWDLADGKEIATLHEHSDPVANVSFSPDGTLLASGSWDKTIKLWDVADSKELTTLYGHSDNVMSVSFSPDGTLLASGSTDRSIKLWTVADGEELNTLHGHSRDIYNVTFSPDGILLASGSADKTIKLWTVVDGEELTTFHEHSNSGSVGSVSFSPDGTLLASGNLDKTIKFWKVANDREITVLYEHYSGWRDGVNFSPDGTILVSGSDDGTIKLWKVEDGSELATLHGHVGDVVTSVTFSPDGILLASGSVSGTIKLWKVEDGSELAILHGHSDAVISVSFSPDGTILASGSWDKTIKLWNVADGSELVTLHGHPNAVITFSPDSTILASGSENDEIIKLWNVADGQEISTLHGHSGYIYAVRFSPDGTMLASGSHDRTIKLWNVADRREISTLYGHSEIVFSISFSSDGTLLASGSHDKTIKLWNVADGSELATLQGHSDVITSVSFSPDGTLLASGSGDRTVKLWHLDLDDLLVRGCEWLHGYLKTNPNVSEADRTVCDDILHLLPEHSLQ